MGILIPQMGFHTMTGQNMLYLSTVYQVSFHHPEFHQKVTCLCICSGAGSLILLKVYLLVRFQILVM
uniref:Uncharacterized protein n=1 Tax=Arundo donax TaxID=35708 RepID=A0A0A9CIS3_ARUDO